MEGEDDRLEVNISWADDAIDPAAVVVAAPVEMWKDVREEWLPRWPIPPPIDATAQVEIPIDGTQTWRLRVRGVRAFLASLPQVASATPTSCTQYVNSKPTFIEGEGGGIFCAGEGIGCTECRNGISYWCAVSSPPGDYNLCEPYFQDGEGVQEDDTFC